MRVVVYEPTSTGHHFALLGRVLPALAALPCEPILVTTPTARRSPEFALHLAALPAHVAVDESLREIGDRRGMAAWRHELDDLTAAVRRFRPDHVYVPYGEGLVRAAALTTWNGRPRWSPAAAAEVLLVRGGFTYPAVGRRARARKRIAPWLIRRGPWERIHHLNPDDQAAMAGRDGRFADRCRLMPDPVEPPPGVSRTQARRALGLPEEGRYVGCVGRIGWRKGAGLLITAFRDAARHLRSDDRLLLAGGFEPDLRAAAERELADEIRSRRVVIVDRLLTSDELGLAISASDLVCTPYRNHPYPASFIIRGAAAGRPLLGSMDGWMGRTIGRFRLGTTCQVTDRAAFADALVTALDEAEAFVPTEAARRFVEFHSVPNFVAHWTALLRERLSLPQPDGRIDWSWVTSALPGAQYPSGRGEFSSPVRPRFDSPPAGPAI